MIIGSGLFIWLIDSCEGGNIPAIIAKCKANNVSWIAPKVADGTQIYWNNKNKLKPLADAAHAAGIKVYGWAWQYGRSRFSPYPSIAIAEADIALKAVKDYNLDGFIIDAEHDWKRTNLNMAAEAEKFMIRLQAGMGNKPVFLASYRYPEYHKDFPWMAFLKHFKPGKGDGHMPQVYWEFDYRPNAGYLQLMESNKQLKALKDMKVYPIGAAYFRGDWVSTPTQMDSMVTAAKELKITGWSWWSFQHMTSAQWGSVKNHAPVVVVPEPEPTPEPEPIPQPTPEKPGEMTGMLKDILLREDILIATGDLTGKDFFGKSLVVPNLPAGAEGVKVRVAFTSNKKGAQFYVGSGNYGNARFQVGHTVANESSLLKEPYERASGDVVLDGSSIWFQHDALDGTVRYFIFIRGYKVP
jgi:hypothetical protein